MRYGFLVLLVACNGDDDVKETGVPLAGPELGHTEHAGVIEATETTLEVTATDADGVSAVTLYHRVSGETTWVQAPMTQGEADVWAVVLEATDVDDPAVEYYFKATDEGDIPATTYLPTEGASEPYELRVSVVGAPLPYVQGFEYDETQSTLSDLGWANSSVGFYGYGWATSASEAYAGTQSAFHSRGYTGIDEMEDWLITPALDFSSVPNAQVTWREFGRQTSLANHALYASVGSRVPEDGDYVVVAETLPAPAEAAWGRSAVYDLSAYAGAPTVYLAWRFVGEVSDDWYLDDVRVEALQPDLVLDAEVTPAPIDPGGEGTFTVSVDNLGLVDAADVAVSVSFPDGGASVAESSVAIDAITAGGSGSAAFSLVVDPSTPDNHYVPVTVTVTEGESTWTLDDQVLVGVVSTATISYTSSAAGSLELVLGVGDPAAPTWEQSVYDDLTSDTLTLSVDITDQGDLLPPTAGALRWFVRATPEVAGRLEDFVVSYDGVDYTATVLPTVIAGGELLAYVPEPPAFEVVASTDPTTLTPGTVGATLGLYVTNDGDATQGAVTATLSSTDPDVTVTDAGPVALTSAAIGAGASVNVAGLFAFDIAATHTDSTDVALELLLDDGVESWTLPVDLAVPFPYLAVSAVGIDDAGNDGVLDADESADLTLTVSNLGDAVTEGALDATLTAESTSTAVVSISTNVESYRELLAGRSDANDDPWTVTVTGGADGDTVDLLLSMVDGARAYEVRTTLILGEPTWEELDPRGDTVGDALSGWDFDLVGGQYRVNDGVLQIRLQSATVFDPSTLFIEAWGYSSVADWTYYRLVVQSGVVTLEGYDSGFTMISTPTVSYPSDTEVQVDIALADMGLSLDSLALGFASGWCGPDEYYCDHFPNGWGYPYDIWSPSLFFDLSW
ncbi:MAG: choice-of-anchor J domain-containing protein [Pseudomonadota bacterium]|nr:choice-of-anchor J domain-containing protein [Pseudomonadota bacterium]